MRGLTPTYAMFSLDRSLLIPRRITIPDFDVINPLAFWITVAVNLRQHDEIYRFVIAGGWAVVIAHDVAVDFP